LVVVGTVARHSAICNNGNDKRPSPLRPIGPGALGAAHELDHLQLVTMPMVANPLAAKGGQISTFAALPTNALAPASNEQADTIGNVYDKFCDPTVQMHVTPGVPRGEDGYVVDGFTPPNPDTADYATYISLTDAAGDNYAVGGNVYDVFFDVGKNGGDRGDPEQPALDDAGRRGEKEATNQIIQTRTAPLSTTASKTVYYSIPFADASANTGSDSNIMHPLSYIAACPAYGGVRTVALYTKEDGTFANNGGALHYTHPAASNV
jgi:hypothetical protein